jgi:hypothetical protein
MQKASHDTVPWLTASSHTAIIPRKRKWARNPRRNRAQRQDYLISKEVTRRQ